MLVLGRRCGADMRTEADRFCGACPRGDSWRLAGEGLRNHLGRRFVCWWITRRDAGGMLGTNSRGVKRISSANEPASAGASQHLKGRKFVCRGFGGEGARRGLAGGRFSLFVGFSGESSFHVGLGIGKAVRGRNDSGKRRLGLGKQGGGGIKHGAD